MSHREDEDMLVCHTLNTIAGGFAGGGETSFAHMRYVCQVMIIEGSHAKSDSDLEQIARYEITFSNKDVVGIYHHDNDPMVKIIYYAEEIRLVLIGHGSSTDTPN